MGVWLAKSNKFSRSKLHKEQRVNSPQLLQLLESVAKGSQSPNSALEKLRTFQVENLGFAEVDHHRQLRNGFSEVVYCEGKTPEQVAEIFAVLNRQTPNASLLGTRANDAHYKAVEKNLDGCDYCEISQCLYLDQTEEKNLKGDVLLVSAGTTDRPVLLEAAHTARLTGSRIEVMEDLGVAGLQRIVSRHERLMKARVIVVAAGMEAALPTVVAGLVPCPVIGIPTSVGYGTSFSGVTALLGMLNSCASNLCCVNIDAGFRAGYLASLINRN
jgi:NCAIR mutase (PurE)-related protein